MNEYLCRNCADENEGKWPEGHVATFHMGLCEYCLQYADLSHISDWDWPKASEIGKKSGTREL